jgi:hypothetical protein
MDATIVPSRIIGILVTSGPGAFVALVCSAGLPGRDFVTRKLSLPSDWNKRSRSTEPFNLRKVLIWGRSRTHGHQGLRIMCISGASNSVACDETACALRAPATLFCTDKRIHTENRDLI